jgi:hypothetical protein
LLTERQQVLQVVAGDEKEAIDVEHAVLMGDEIPKAGRRAQAGSEPVVEDAGRAQRGEDFPV